MNKTILLVFALVFVLAVISNASDRKKINRKKSIKKSHKKTKQEVLSLTNPVIIVDSGSSSTTVNLMVQDSATNTPRAICRASVLNLDIIDHPDQVEEDEWKAARVDLSQPRDFKKNPTPLSEDDSNKLKADAAHFCKEVEGKRTCRLSFSDMFQVEELFDKNEDESQQTVDAVASPIKRHHRFAKRSRYPGEEESKPTPPQHYLNGVGLLVRYLRVACPAAGQFHNAQLFIITTDETRKAMIEKGVKSDFSQVTLADADEIISHEAKLPSQAESDSMEIKVLKQVTSGRFEGVFSWLSLEENMRLAATDVNHNYHFSKICSGAISFTDCLKKITHVDVGGFSTQVTFPMMGDQQCEKLHQIEPEPIEDRSQMPQIEVINEKPVEPEMSRRNHRNKLRRSRKTLKSRKTHKSQMRTKAIVEFREVGIVNAEVAEALGMRTDNIVLFSKSFLFIGNQWISEHGKLTDCALQASESDGVAIYEKCKTQMAALLNEGAGNKRDLTEIHVENGSIDQQFKILNNGLACGVKDIGDLKTMVLQSRATYLSLVESKKVAAEASGPEADFFQDISNPATMHALCGKAQGSSTNKYFPNMCMNAVLPHVLADIMGGFDRIVVYKDRWFLGFTTYIMARGLENTEQINFDLNFQPSENNYKENEKQVVERSISKALAEKEKQEEVEMLGSSMEDIHAKKKKMNKKKNKKHHH